MRESKVFIIFILSFSIIGCSGGSLGKEIIKEINSGTYRLSGTQIEITYDFPWPSFGGEEEILSRDTSDIEFTVEIKYSEGRQDTIQFIGLEGADAGEHYAVVPCNVRPQIIPQCLAFAKLSGTELIFDLTGFGGSYTGSGYLGKETLNLKTHFEYRSVGIDYSLEGKKVDD